MNSKVFGPPWDFIQIDIPSKKAFALKKPGASHSRAALSGSTEDIESNFRHRKTSDFAQSQSPAPLAGDHAYLSRMVAYSREDMPRPVHVCSSKELLYNAVGLKSGSMPP